MEEELRPKPAPVLVNGRQEPLPKLPPPKACPHCGNAGCWRDWDLDTRSWHFTCSVCGESIHVLTERLGRPIDREALRREEQDRLLRPGRRPKSLSA